MEHLINDTAIYSIEGFNKLLKNAEVKAALKKQYGTSNIQVFENFLALPPGCKPDTYKQELLSQLIAWSEQELTAKRAEIERQQEFQAEVERLMALVNVFIEENDTSNEAVNQQAIISEEQQSKQLNPEFSWAKTLTIASTLLFLSGAAATGLFFIGLPLWAILTAGIGSFMLGTLAVASYSCLRTRYSNPINDDSNISTKSPNFYYASDPTNQVKAASNQRNIINQQIPAGEPAQANNSAIAML